MTKKDYIAIAGAIYAEHKYRGDSITPDDIVRVLAQVLKADNPRFEEERFREACTTGKTRGMRQVTV